MDWNEAKSIISGKIVAGTDINTIRSKLRKIIRVNHKCTNYDYNGEEGFLVRISNYDSNNLDIPWSMIEKCYYSLEDDNGYNGNVFRKLYSKQAKDHPCHVHVVGMIFKKAGIEISDSDEMKYFLKQTSRIK